MLAVAVAIAMIQDEPAVRTRAIYRCPRVEAESKFFQEMVDESGFDSFCVEPSPGPSATALAKGKVRFVTASIIDTKANLAWRDKTIDFVNGKISPRAWLAGIKNLKETVHFLSSPKTPTLRQATSEIISRAVGAELLVCAWPGTPCFTANDIGQTRYLPGPGRLESWLLAMNDLLGPMLYYRHSNPYLVTGKPQILRADDKPGLLIFRQTNGKETLTIYINNATTPVELPPVNMEKMTINAGLNVDEDKARLMQNGFLIEES